MIQRRQGPGPEGDETGGLSEIVAHLLYPLQSADQSIFFGEKALQNAVSEFLTHYHQERNHQGLNNQLLQPGIEVGRTAGDVECRERLGGILRYYYRQAA